MKKNRLLSLLSFTLLVPLPMYAEHIILDLGGVAIETGYLQTILTLGWEFAAYASTWRNPFSSHQLLFTFLETIPIAYSDNTVAKDAHGHPLPPLMVAWLKGQLSPEEIFALICNSPGNFSNWTEEALVRALAELIFTPAYFVKTRSLIKESITFIQECKQAGHSVYILSNWDPYSCALLKIRWPNFFALFDGIVISGEIGLIKPDPGIYQYLLQKYQLDPDDCFFIDDQEENVIAAQKEGITTYKFSKRWGLFGSSDAFMATRNALKTWLTAKYFFDSAKPTSALQK